MSKRGSYGGEATIHYTATRDDEEITLVITGNIQFTPGNYSGKPEDCYPDECDVTIESITDEKGNVWDESELTADENEDVQAQLFHASRKYSHED